MSISRRFLTFIFATITACLIFACGEVLAQKYSGLDMPRGFYLTPKTYQQVLKDDQKTWPKSRKDALAVQQRAWSKENRRALDAIREGRTTVGSVLAAGGDVSSDPEARKFLEDYAFPSMTQTDADTLSSLGMKRQEFLKNYLSSRVTGNARIRMIDFTVEKLQAYSVDATLHPSARLNAVVLLSQLTDRPLDGDRRQTPIASRKATAALQGILRGEDKNQYPEFLKLAALSGVKRQLEMNFKSGQAVNRAIRDQLVDVVTQVLPVETDREKDAVGYWKKRQAVQLAGLLNDAKVLPLLMAIMNDDVSSLEMKLDAVRSISQAGVIGTDPKTNNTVLLAICKFARTAVGNEAVHLQDSVEKMVRDGFFFGDKDLRQTGVDFEPGLEKDKRTGDFNGGRDSETPPLVELPNYQLNISRNRIRSVALSCQQAIGVTSQSGLRQHLDTKAGTLASRTVGLLGSLLEKSSVGLIDVEGSDRRPGAPTPQETDKFRGASYVDQMAKLCTDSAEALATQLSNYTGE